MSFVTFSLDSISKFLELKILVWFGLDLQNRLNLRLLVAHMRCQIDRRRLLASFMYITSENQHQNPILKNNRFVYF